MAYDTLQLRRAPDAIAATLVPADGEALWYQDSKRLAIGDGVTVGGVIQPFSAEPIAETYITASGPHIYDTATKLAIVEVLGGGASGGSSGTSNVNHASTGSGGGAGGWAQKMIVLNDITSAMLTIGAGGASVTGNPASDGNAGGNTVYDDGTNLITANGGSAGLGQVGTSATVGKVGGDGGLVTGGDLNVQGRSGGKCIQMGGTTTGSSPAAFAGDGADSPYGASGKGAVLISGTSASQSGGDASGYGSGGGGGANVSDASAGADSGAGAPGLVIIREYS